MVIGFSQRPSTMAKAFLSVLPDNTTSRSLEAKPFMEAFEIVETALKRNQKRGLTNNRETIDISKEPEEIALSMFTSMVRMQTYYNGKESFLAALDMVKRELNHRALTASLTSATKLPMTNIVLSGVPIPSETLIRVLEFLPHKSLLQAGLVSKAFLAERQKCRWSELPLKQSSLNLNSVLDLLSHRQFSDVRYLQLPARSSFKLSEEGIQSLVKVCPQLTNIDLCRVAMKPTDVPSLVKSFRNLSGINCQMTEPWKRPALEAILHMGGRLRKLGVYVSSRGYLRDDDLKRIADDCPGLASLEVTCNFRESGWGSALDSPGIVHHLIPKCHNLKHLKVPGLDIETLKEMSVTSHNLTSFELDFVIQSKPPRYQKLGTGGLGDDIYQVIQQQVSANKASG